MFHNLLHSGRLHAINNTQRSNSRFKMSTSLEYFFIPEHSEILHSENDFICPSGNGMSWRSYEFDYPCLGIIHKILHFVDRPSCNDSW